MVTLKGETLGERQQELNRKVNETIAKNINFEEVRAETNTSDIDMLYVVDVASKCKNIKYIIEILKGGDSLYISRALKCNWLYSDDFSNIINADYLHHNIFPFMSLKIKNKFLTIISMHLRNERAASFYTYCFNMKLYNIAIKFLIYTSESFKLDVIKGPSAILNKIIEHDRDHISFLIGNSFILANAYMIVLNEYQRAHELYKLRYLFSVSNIEYLNLLQKYQQVDNISYRFGLRISKQTLSKYKDRCLQHPLLYMNILNKSSITKYLTVDIAKNIAVKLLPSKVENFWNETAYCIAYDFILNIIPASERFQWLKNIFNNKYPGEEFEMTKDFFNLKCYMFMTREEKESWALSHIEGKKEIQGDGCDYLWYKFLSFDVAFPEVKKYIKKTKDFRIRAEIVNVLIESARNQCELEILLNYYHNRHMNEAKRMKESFITSVIQTHNIFELDHDCWVAFNKILYSLDIYNIRGQRNNFITFAALLYHIIHKIDIPEAFQKFIESEFYWYNVSGDALYSKIGNENQEAVYQYLLKFYRDRMAKVQNDVSDENSKDIKRRCVESVLDLLKENNKSIDDCPEIIKDYIESNWKQFEYYGIVNNKYKFTEGKMLRSLKQDAKNVTGKISDVRSMLKDYRLFKMNTFLKKINIYFQDNIAKYYLDFFNEIISEKDFPTNGVYTAVYGIFQLADEHFKEAFMSKYAPSDPKIDYTKIDTQTLCVQGGICRFACFSRPPVPLSNIMMYIVGDYLQHCLPIFNSYLANLPMPLCIKFTESIIDSPVSIQKHGIRLAFHSFNTENLKKLIGDIWHKTKNVSLRLIIYQALYNKIVGEDETLQQELFEILKSFTLDLHEEDLNEIYDLLGSSNLPEYLLREYIAVAWQTVNKLSDNSTNVKRKRVIILNIKRNLHILDALFVKPIVEEHITDQLVKAEMKNCYEISYIEHLYSAKWELVAAYMIYFVNNKDLYLKNIELAQFVIKKSVEMWNTVHNEIYTFRRFCWDFIDFLIHRPRNNGSYEDTIPIYEAVLLSLQELLPLRVIYLKCWSLRLAILNRKFAQAGNLKFDKEATKVKRLEIFKESTQNFAHAAGNFIKQSVEDKMYFNVSISDLKEMICSNVRDIKCAIGIHDDVSEDWDDLYVAAVAGLLQINLPETYILAVNIMPVVSPEHSGDEYESIMNKIKQFDNGPVQFCLYQKFVNSDFKKRKLDI